MTTQRDGEGREGAAQGRLGQDMVERVAEAFHPGILDAAAKHPNDCLIQANANYALKRARAAIEAMRDPTPEMIEAGAEHDDPGVWDDPGHGNADAKTHWQAMIDAALAEGGEK